MKPWQAAQKALESGAPLDDEDSWNPESRIDLSDSSDFSYNEAPTLGSGQAPVRKLIYFGFATYPDEVFRANGEIRSQQHRPNERCSDSNLQDQIIKLDEAIMWELKPLEEKLQRLYLLRDIRNELYYINNSEEK